MKPLLLAVIVVLLSSVGFHAHGADKSRYSVCETIKDSQGNPLKNGFVHMYLSKEDAPSAPYVPAKIDDGRFNYDGYLPEGSYWLAVCNQNANESVCTKRLKNVVVGPKHSSTGCDVSLNLIADADGLTHAAVEQTVSANSQVEPTFCSMSDEPAEISVFKPVGPYTASIAIKNNGKYGKIMSYRIGFFTSTDKKQRKYDLRVRLIKPLPTGETGPTVLEGVEEWRGKPPDRVEFFVAEVEFADKSVWFPEAFTGRTPLVCEPRNLSR
jgi:hypothetical protein